MLSSANWAAGGWEAPGRDAACWDADGFFHL